MVRYKITTSIDSLGRQRWAAANTNEIDLTPE
jgi:hypothetical protein